VTALSYALPAEHAATGVGLAFLTLTYWLALSGDNPDAARLHGMSLGGLLDPEPISLRRLAGATARAVAWSLAVALVILPPFWLGYVIWWAPTEPFSPAPIADLLEDAPGQLLVIALPEEAFYRGYLQSALDRAWPPRWRVLGAELGPALIVAAALFALGHILTEVHVNRLAVFFPALLFGWLRARTGGIGASVCVHALCNLFASYLAKSYGFG
jgi:membrane protease YdiL (CAAX protease family)